MAVLWGGGEFTSVVISGAGTGLVFTPTFQTGLPSLSRTAFSRGALSIGDVDVGTTYPLTRYYSSQAWDAASSDFWFHAAFGSLGAQDANTANQPMVWFADASGTDRLFIRGTGTAGQFKISKRSAAGVFTDLATGTASAFPPSELGMRPIFLDVHVEYSTTGRVRVYLNGTLVADTGASVDVTTDAATALARVSVCSLVKQASGNTHGWSELLVADVDTRGAALWTIAPAASGTTQLWTPNTVGNINETGINDGTWVATPTAGQKSGWTVSTTVPTGSWSVLAIIQDARVSAGLSGPLHFEWYYRSAAGTDYTTGSETPVTAFANFQHVWNTDPATGIAWTTAAFAAGMNLGIASLA